MTERVGRDILHVVDEAGNPLDRPKIDAILGNMVATHLAPMSGLLLPVVLKIPRVGGAWLYAYAFDSRALRVQISPRILKEMATPAGTLRAFWELRNLVADLAANFRSRQGSSQNYFRSATRTHVAMTTGRRARRNTAEGASSS